MLLFSRVLEKIYISVGNLKPTDDKRIEKVLEIINKHPKALPSDNKDSTLSISNHEETSEKFSIAKVGPIMDKDNIVDAAVISKGIFALLAIFF